ncbi:MAG: UDP-N-acetylmuramate--L-alanine ligase [Actinomycetales bacterium]
MNERFDLSALVPPASDLGPTHFLGIGGIGMSGIARIMVRRGLAVSGSDARDSPIMARLRELGADARPGFDVSRLDGVQTVVASSAIREGNPELAGARQRGLRVLHRSQALQALMADRVGVCVAGTNGKTTTTSMLTVLAREAGLDPSFAIGGELVGAETNAEDGTGRVFIAEADESDASFLVYTPTVSVVTNVQPDHLDFYGTADRVVAAFEAFADRLVDDGREGTLVACLDDPGSAALAQRCRDAGRRVIGYGTHPDAEVRVDDVELAAGVSFTLHDRICVTQDRDATGGGSQRIRLAVPGRHNALNAAAAYAAARALGVEPAAATAGLEAFRGSRRRFEFRGEAGGVRVFDDYAHNPAKVAAAVATGRQAAGQGRLIVAFQPHLYSRTRDFAVEFGIGLAGADEILVLDVYAAREDPLPGVSGALVAEAVPADRPTGAGAARFVSERASVAAELVRLASPGDLVLTIGAGDVTTIAGDVLAGLADGERGGSGR